MLVLTQQRASALSRPRLAVQGEAWAHESIERPAAVNGAAAGGNIDDGEFVEFQAAYRSTGGLAHGDELAARLHVDGTGGYARLARWIVARQVFSFTWNEHFWLPMFQFDGTDLSPHRCLRPVLSELVDVMDGRALAAWFAQPNDALQGFCPVAMWTSHWPDVFQAARLQRFVVKG